MNLSVKKRSRAVAAALSVLAVALLVTGACQGDPDDPSLSTGSPATQTVTGVVERPGSVEPGATNPGEPESPTSTTAQPTKTVNPENPGSVASPTSTATTNPADAATPVATSPSNPATREPTVNPGTPGTADPTVIPSRPTPIPSGNSGSSSVVSPTPTSTPTPIPPPTATPTFRAPPPEPNIPVPPDRDLQAIGRRLVEGYEEPQEIVPSEPYVVGQKVDFWVSRDNGSVLVSGEVAHVSEHAYWIFEDRFIPEPADIATAAEGFETEVWPAVTEVFGPPLTPGIDGDDRIVVYNGALRTGVAGYFSSADSYPREIVPFSNQREAVYMAAGRIKITSSEYLSVLAHELQHASHFASDSSEDSWINEGLSEMAAEIAGFDRSAVGSFVRAPSTSLTAWAQNIAVSRANYGAANLFFAFLATHYGGTDMLAAISRNQEDGIASVDRALSDRGFSEGADDVYSDWLVANYLSTDVGPYSYDFRDVPPVRNIYKRAPDSLGGNVKSYGADYVVTSTGSGRMTVEFQGEPRTPLISEPPHSGSSCWWSNQGDSIDSTLTRSVDLGSVGSATLKYWTFYEIEESWDYAYVMVSTDGGETWQILETSHSTTENPNGNAYGAGLTGQSRTWVQDSVDLSRYAGKQILLRFEYITDDAVFSKGACFDDFEIPEIGWSDDTSSDADWTANGFARVEETVPTQYLVQVVHEKDLGDPIVYQLPVDAQGTGSLLVEGVGDDDLIIAIISAVNRHSTSPTEYTLGITP